MYLKQRKTTRKEPTMTSVYITSVSGTLVAEVNGVKRYELTDCIYDMGWGFGESHEIDFDMDEQNDVWGLVDAIYEQKGE